MWSKPGCNQNTGVGGLFLTHHLHFSLTENICFVTFLDEDLCAPGSSRLLCRCRCSQRSGRKRTTGPRPSIASNLQPLHSLATPPPPPQGGGGVAIFIPCTSCCRPQAAHADESAAMIRRIGTKCYLPVSPRLVAAFR